MVELASQQLPNGTQFIKHELGSDRFVFEIRYGHVLTVSISSSYIRWYYELLGRRADQVGKTIGEIGPNHGMNVESHAVSHELGVSANFSHSHWGSLRNSLYDGYTLLTLLSVKLGRHTTSQIAAVAKNPPTTTNPNK